MKDFCHLNINLHFCKVNSIKRLIPNLFTAGNLVGGILAIIFTLTGRVDIAPYCIFISALFDFLDGFMARLLKVPSEIGKQLDSLADMVTFGVAPGLIIFVLMGGLVWFDFEGLTYSFENIDSTINNENVSATVVQFSFLKFLPFIAFLIPVFALFRLAKFNLDTRQTDAFIGLPTPAMTLFFAVLPILFNSTYVGVLNASIHLSSWEVIAAKSLSSPYTLAILSIIFSILMVVELPLFALKFKHFKWKDNEIRYIFLTLSVVLLATLFLWAIPLIVILYVILSLINTQIRKAKTDEI